MSIHNEVARLSFPSSAVQRLIHILDAHAGRFVAGGGGGGGGIPDGELSLAFLSDAALARLHADFLDDPTTTDVITFEATPGMGSAGEICVSVDTAARYAREHGHDFAEELALYIVHGWLHLAGYDDLQPMKKRRMRAAEKRAIALLRQAGALPSFVLRAPNAKVPVRRSRSIRSD
ncbi:rRNA maturation RNase YbeY [Geminisphaera colitermitum]|uniref:rRNA maturation RNase YbeY n=1 Tax=Geminisphaera colitermitum TaxID=1148786 RepID=UPI001E3053BD|nr:rRNA maturation RNase YbeY [Geminisphaera colitermitum]